MRLVGGCKGGGGVCRTASTVRLWVGRRLRSVVITCAMADVRQETASLQIGHGTRSEFRGSSRILLTDCLLYNKESKSECLSPSLPIVTDAKASVDRRFSYIRIGRWCYMTIFRQYINIYKSSLYSNPRLLICSNRTSGFYPIFNSGQLRQMKRLN